MLQPKVHNPMLDGRIGRYVPGTLSRRLRGNDFELSDDANLEELDLPRSTIELCPESVARENEVLPVHFDGETIVLATEDIADVMKQDKLRFILNLNVAFVGRRQCEILAAIDHFYGLSDGVAVDSMLQEITDTAIDFTESDYDDVEFSLGHSADSSPAMRRSQTSSRVKGYSGQKRELSSVNQQGNGFMFYTIAEGDRVLAHRPNGKLEVLYGPLRVFKGWTRFEPMRQYVAHPGQYISIGYRDGREEILLGPAEVWHDPREHESISVNECLDLAAKEAVVVYGTGRETATQNSKEDNVTSRRIFYGPGLFAPRPGEWLHRFSWHASKGGSRGAEKRPNALQFEKLCLMPDQMYHDVQDVRTADDAVLTIRLMIFFELVDIDRMLDTTRDPIGDFINAATSDVVEFTGKRSFEEFKQQTEQLNEIETYGQLLHRAGQCGYKINNVVYRGYGAPDSLQAMHDEAIQTRTRLQLEKATEQQAQEVEDYRLKCQMERSERRREEQMSEIEHDLEMKRKQSAEDLAQRDRNEQFKRAQRQSEQELELRMRAQFNSQTQEHLDALRNMRVDLTEYLTQGRADQVIEVRGDSDTKPELHLSNGKSDRKAK